MRAGGHRAFLRLSGLPVVLKQSSLPGPLRPPQGSTLCGLGRVAAELRALGNPYAAAALIGGAISTGQNPCARVLGGVPDGGEKLDHFDHLDGAVAATCGDVGSDDLSDACVGTN